MKAARDNAARSKLQHALTNRISDPDHRRQKRLSILLRLGGRMQECKIGAGLKETLNPETLKPSTTYLILISPKL